MALERRKFPSGERARPVTVSVCPFNRIATSNLRRSQPLIMLSIPPEKIISAVSLKVTESTCEGTNGFIALVQFISVNKRGKTKDTNSPALENTKQNISITCFIFQKTTLWSRQ